MSRYQNIRYYFRNHASGYSIARAMMPVAEFTAGSGRMTDIVELPYPGTNPRTVLKNMWYALRTRKRDCINHITGEAHYLTYLLPPERTIVTVHDLGGLFSYTGFDLKYYRWRCVNSLLRARFVVAISEATRRVILGNSTLSPDKLRVIYDPLPAGFNYCPKNFNSEKPVVLQVGAAKWKNPARIAEALNGLNIHFRIVGIPDAECIGILERNQTEYSIVTDLDDAELIREYERADIVAFASSSEGFGMPLIEAQAVGRPVVASNIEPQPEIGGAGGALYVDPADIKALRGAFVKLISEPQLREDIIGCGLENISRFSIRNIAARYAELYAEMD